VKGKPNKEYYDVKVEQLALLEKRAELGEIDILYGDETQISEEGYVPYGWQFSDGNVCIESAKGAHINCFGLLSRDNSFVYETSENNITSDFVIEQLDKLSFEITKSTVVILDNAKVHRAKKVQDMRKYWAKRNLFIFFLPPYSPHLNLIERLWKEIKSKWIAPKDYINKEHLFYATKLICDAIGKSIFIKFNPFSYV